MFFESGDLYVYKNTKKPDACPVDCSRFSHYHIVRYGAFNASRSQPGPGGDGFSVRTVYSRQRHLRDRPCGGGHLSALEPVRTAGDPAHDTDRGPGVCDDWRDDSSDDGKKDRSCGPGPVEGQREYTGAWRRGAPGKADHKRDFSGGRNRSMPSVPAFYTGIRDRGGDLLWDFPFCLRFLQRRL